LFARFPARFMRGFLASPSVWAHLRAGVARGLAGAWLRVGWGLRQKKSPAEAGPWKILMGRY
jgi:hypothetical protein